MFLHRKFKSKRQKQNFFMYLNFFSFFIVNLIYFFYFISTCRPYQEVLPYGYCKDYIANQFTSQDDAKAKNIDSHLREITKILKGSYIEVDPDVQHQRLQMLNKRITGTFIIVISIIRT